MRIIIAGGRDFSDYTKLKDSVRKIIRENGGNTIGRNNIEIVSGKARGADSLGEKFAREFNLKIVEFPADWDTHGKSAGYKRNAEMAKYASENNGILIAFWDTKSKGTKHMIDLGERYGLIVYQLTYTK